MRSIRAAIVVIPVVVATACSSSGVDRAPDFASASERGSADVESATPSSQAPPSQAPPSQTPTETAAPSESPAPTPPPTAPLAGKTVVIDPGHNGANASNPQVINQQVPDGNGGTKACNTTGTATNGGYAEHEMNWQIGIQVRDQLVAQGASVVLTRPDDVGIGPCVNVRAQIGNDANADAVVSLHGDGAAASARGFFCILSPLNPGGADTAAQSKALAERVRDGIAATGVMPTANYEGADGIDPKRTDLAGLNLSTRPTTLCELGNMRSDADAAVQTSESGRTALASGIANGIVTFLTA